MWITTNVVSSNPTQALQHYVIKFVSDLRQVGGFSIRARWTTLCDKVCQWLATGRWFSSTLCDKVCQWLTTGRWFSPHGEVYSIQQYV